MNSVFTFLRFSPSETFAQKNPQKTVSIWNIIIGFT